MLPTTKKDFRLLRLKEAAKAGYPGGMTRGKTRIVIKKNKEQVINFFGAGEFKIPLQRTFEDDHKKICSELSKILKLNPIRKQLNKETVAAKFVDTFLYQLTKFDEYYYLSKKLNLIIDNRVITKLRKISDNELKIFLDSYPNSVYEATYHQYQDLQIQITEFIQRSKNPFILKKIDLNILWP